MTPLGKRQMLAKPDVKVSSTVGTDMKHLVVGHCVNFVVGTKDDTWETTRVRKTNTSNMESIDNEHSNNFMLLRFCGDYSCIAVQLRGSESFASCRSRRFYGVHNPCQK